LFGWLGTNHHISSFTFAGDAHFLARFYVGMRISRTNYEYLKEKSAIQKKKKKIEEEEEKSVSHCHNASQCGSHRFFFS
jgi:hypothetical protein